MNEDRMADPTSGEQPDQQEQAPAPSGLFWPLKRAWWALEKHVLWPIADFFRRMAEGMRYRSPLAYIGAAALVCLTAGAVVAAVHSYNEANSSEPDPVVTEAQLGADTVVEPVQPPPTAGAPADGGQDEDETLQGVVPGFDNSAGKSGGNGSGSDGSGGSGNSGGNGGGRKLPNTAVRPADLPDSPPLKVAHRFANTFVGYEVGEKKAKKTLRRTTTGKLAGELVSRPPRLPANGRVPKASVLNVVSGKKRGRRMEVSVSLMRSGATSELRLALTRQNKKGWLVSEVRG